MITYDNGAGCEEVFCGETPPGENTRVGSARAGVESAGVFRRERLDGVQRMGADPAGVRALRRARVAGLCRVYGGLWWILRVVAGSGQWCGFARD